MSLYSKPGLLYNEPVDRREHRTGIGPGRPDPPPRVLELDWLNAEYPVDGDVVHTERPTPLDSDVHHTFEAGILLAGKQERHFEGLVRVVEPGDAWWTAAWEPHGWRVTAAATDELVIHFVPELLGEAAIEGRSWLSFFAGAPDQRAATTSAETRRRVLNLGGQLADEFARKRWGWRDMARSGLVQLLTIVTRDSGPPREEASGRESAPGMLSRIMPAIELLHSDLSTRLPVSAAADVCGLSRSWFRSLFQDTMGMTYSRFERRARLARAARLLLTTNAPIEAIAQEAGFADGSHFHRAFFKHYARTPDEFRTRGRQVRERPEPDHG